MSKHTASWLFAGVIAALGITILCIPYNRKSNPITNPSNDTITNTSLTEFQPNPVNTMVLQDETEDTIPFVEPPFATTIDPRLNPINVDTLPDASVSLSFTNMRLSDDGSYSSLTTSKDAYRIYYMSMSLSTQTTYVQTSITYVDDDFHNNLLLIRNKNKWGYLNPLGRVEIPCIYDYASPFENGTATVRKNVTWHQIDTTGRIVYTYRDSLPYHLESIVTESQKLHPVKNIRKRLTKVFELYESWRIQYMTNPAFRYFYATGSSVWDNPKRYPMPPIEDAEKGEYYGQIHFTPCLFNGDSIPDYFITIYPEDLGNGSGRSAAHPPIYLLIISDKNTYQLHNDLLRRQYKAFQHWIKLYDGDYIPEEGASPKVRIDSIYKHKNEFILEGNFNEAYSRIGQSFITHILNPDTPKEWSYSTIEVFESPWQYELEDYVSFWCTTPLYH